MRTDKAEEDGWWAAGIRLFLIIVIGLVVTQVEFLRDVAGVLVGLVIVDLIYGRLGRRQWLPLRTRSSRRTNEPSDR